MVSIFGLWFCFALNVAVPWFFSLGVSYLTCFYFQELSVETLNFETDFGYFEETEL